MCIAPVKSRSSVPPDGYLCPKIGGKELPLQADYLPETQFSGRPGTGKVKTLHLNGNVARRIMPPATTDFCLWDNELIGFGLRIRPSGKRLWFVRLRERGRHRRISLGCTMTVDAITARAKAKKLLAAAALDGLPKRPEVRENPTLAVFVEAYWDDLSRVWKPSTQLRNRNVWRLELTAVFGTSGIADITRADVIRWRDDCAGGREARYNRAVPVLGALLKYAEALNLRPKGSNPCRAIARYKRPAKERYLAPQEYYRLARELSAAASKHPAEVAIIRLLIFTGARISEIRDLRWEWVKETHLALPDSKTGPRTIWLNRQAIAILDRVRKRGNCPFVFPDKKRQRPMRISAWWSALRRRCAMPDLRIHDLRHSFASVAIMDNVPLATLGEALGHGLPETTAKYAHFADEVIADAADRMSGFLANAIGLVS